MIVLDASVLMAYLDSENAHHERAEALLAREIDDEFAISSLTLAEVLAVLRSHTRLKMRGPGQVTSVPLPTREPLRASGTVRPSWHHRGRA